ncbi:hypothetical protein [Mycolicibacterium neworleansense]|uniref:Uncharacterized protein n=1 Tax=Mycolicibacterium neworleansense TaxID=146018 RepID=A0A0H5RTL0_9MYCO|nr:hypothetical protein [Mycolicibacterium neworleansense]MCV7363227.1 hypothetical protein [Mycolicibacterium neworleansense]CRZ17121.1 hypothetical protein BN2156_04002 [Mycolicibacterium neworleansense]
MTAVNPLIHPQFPSTPSGNRVARPYLTGHYRQTYIGSVNSDAGADGRNV